MEIAAEKKETLDRLSRTLQEYLEAVPRQKMPDPPDLLAIFARLDALEKEVGPGYPAQLRHYLHQKSYRKAYLYLQDSDSENIPGSCAE
ncbi:MAG: hypothetical protein LV480_03860 [Methylacidiphilales bacterium]|nr:hypothetical protein [Candidatus Methylacidiphilales bacterium]